MLRIPGGLFYRDGRLIAEAQQDSRKWTASWNGPAAHRWYFVELSWNGRTGLEMYVDLDRISSDSSAVVHEPQRVDDAAAHAYLGADMMRSNYVSATVDDLEFWFGERRKLIELDFLLRGNR